MCERREKGASVMGGAHSEGEPGEKRFGEEMMSSPLDTLGLGHLWVPKGAWVDNSCIPRLDAQQGGLSGNQPPAGC